MNESHTVCTFAIVKKQQNLYKDKLCIYIYPWWLYHGPLGVVCFAGPVIMNIFFVKLSVVDISFFHNLKEDIRWDIIHGFRQKNKIKLQVKSSLSWGLRSLVPCSYCGKRKLADLLSSASWSYVPASGRTTFILFLTNDVVLCSALTSVIFRFYLIVADSVPAAGLIRHLL